ncbi:MAG: DNA repair exonuclease [Dehalococcoidales bacterium]|nr:DNA repair exonuclease [Dehalococcoidales bacterium]
MIRVLHTADVHLDRRFPFLHGKGSEYRKQLLRTFEKIVDLAISEDVSLFLIAGDLFDSNRVHGITIAKVLSAFKKLEASGIRVCILPGTHDAYDEDSIYRLVRFPSNVTVFTPEHGQETYENLNLTVYGRVFDSKSPGKNPIRELPLAEQSEFHIGMAHCSVSRPGMIENKAVMLEESDIASSGLDYLALGHWHSFQDMSQGNTKACYSGSPEPIDTDQKGAGNVSMVTIHDKNNIEFSPIRVGTKKCEAITIDIDSVKSIDSIIEMIEAKADPDLILEVSLTGLSSMDFNINTAELEDELSERFFHLRVLDRSHPKLSELKAQEFPEETVMGRFLRIMAKKMATASNEEETLVYEEALKLGVTLLQGRLQVIE